MLAELELAKNELEEFVYLASHDLSSPINAIANLSTWLIEDIGSDINEESQRNLALINGRSERAKKMINDLLTYSRVGKKADEYQTFDFYEAVACCAAQLNRKSFEFDICQGEVTLPKVLFMQVIEHLISNAIKHHPNDNGVVKVHFEQLSQTYRVMVEDDGAGIPANDYAMIFNPFKTLKPRDTVEGSGMGLSIVKKVLEKLGGDISVESDGESGAVFVCDWPIQQGT